MKNLLDGLSFWESKELGGKPDYLVLGCGIVGTSCAIELKTNYPNLNVWVVDKKSFPLGASTRNAGFACFGSVSEILDDIEKGDDNYASKLIQMRWRGLELLRSRLGDEEIHYRQNGGSEIFQKNQEDYYISKLDRINDLLTESIGVQQVYSVQKGRYGTEIFNREEGSLYPNQMMRELYTRATKLGVHFINGVHCLEIELENTRLITKNGFIPYEHLIVCTNGFSSELLPSVDLKPARNQVIITKPIKEFRLGPCYHMYKGYVYFREIGGRLLLGGGRHLDIEGETTDVNGTTELIQDYLRNLAEKIIPPNSNLEIERSWSGVLGVSADKLPIIEKRSDNVYIAVKMGGMGVAIGSYIGRVVSAMILQDDNSDLNLYVS